LIGKIGMKWGVMIALIAGLVAAIYLFWVIGFESVLMSVARAGLGGLLALCLCSLAVTAMLSVAWRAVLPPERRLSQRRFFLARLVREAIAEISPFSPVGGLLAAARLVMLYGMDASYAAASVATDMTTEAMAQVPFLAFGVTLAVGHMQHFSGGLMTAMLASLLLAVPGIVLLIVLQKRGAGLAQRAARRFLPGLKEGSGFQDAIHRLYDSPSRLAASASLHLLAWIASGFLTFLAFRLVGGDVTLLNALALEALLCTLRSVAAFVPAAIGVQEAGYAMLAPLFGLPAEMGLAVSLLKRAREIVLGVPALIYWQGVEGRKALAGMPHV
jgi:putative membrane protein